MSRVEKMFKIVKRACSAIRYTRVTRKNLLVKYVLASSSASGAINVMKQYQELEQVSGKTVEHTDVALHIGYCS